VVENYESAEKLNSLLHQYGEYVIGRMGVPYRARKISIISVAIDAPETVISALAGKLGMLPGVSVKIVYATKEQKPLAD
jgi:putative iron-only hydrogenase system regulator